MNKKKAIEALEKLEENLDGLKAFCPTGPGGGVDNSCGRGGSSSGEGKPPVFDIVGYLSEGLVDDGKGNLVPRPREDKWDRREGILGTLGGAAQDIIDSIAR